MRHGGAVGHERIGGRRVDRTDERHGAEHALRRRWGGSGRRRQDGIGREGDAPVDVATAASSTRAPSTAAVTLAAMDPVTASARSAASRWRMRPGTAVATAVRASPTTATSAA